jgi:rubrerythrin
MPDQMKLNGDRLCLEHTDNCRTESLGTILSMLASEEMEHFNTIAFLEAQTGNCSPAKTKVQENVNTVFLRMKEDEADECFDYSELDYYRKTLNFEEVGRLFYLKKAADAELKNDRQLFLSLAGEVEKHQRILETILALTVRPEPGKRLGNA